MHANVRTESLRALFALVVGLAVLFTPAVTRAAITFGGMPDHELMMEQTGHCQMPPSGSADHEKSQRKNCCISMCMAVGITPAAPTGGEFVEHVPPVASSPTFHIRYLGEIATPPPRSV